MFGRVFAFLIGVMISAICAHGADAAIPLRASACIARWERPSLPPPARIAALPFTCGDPEGASSRYWTWFRLDATQLGTLPAEWRLLAVQTRFDRVALIAVARDGSVQRILRDADRMGDTWAPGGLIRLTVARPGHEIVGLYLGFERLDDVKLVRTIRAVTEEEEIIASDRWLVLMGLFTGTLLSAFAYSLLLLDRRRQYAFQYWYLAWTVAALTYGVIWSNLLGFVIPGFVGPIAVRADYLLVGLMIGICTIFFLSLVEDGLLPRWLLFGGRTVAAAGIAAGIVAASDSDLVSPIAIDRLMNYLVMAGTVLAFTGIGYAIRRGSRVVWFYVAGWGPVITIFALRVLRNLGFFSESDLLDMAMFGALAFEAVILSFATADRFRALRHQLKLAALGHERDLAETALLRRIALTDPLTCLGNRAAFQQELHARVAAGPDAPFLLFLIDVDHLKAVNDRLGHAAGDAFLRHVAMRLADLAIDGVFAARLGGDEFALLAAQDAGLAGHVEQRLDALQGTEWDHLGNQRAVSLSIGSARFPADAADADLLYQNADLALYQAKRLGRASRRGYEPVLRIQSEIRTAFVTDATAAIERREFMLHLQPVRDLRTGGIVAYEALLRWQHPERGILLPEQFADLLVDERIGLRMQDHVLDLALQLLGAHPDDIPALNVNFTAAQLTGPAAARRLLDRLALFGVPPHALCIEVTEGVMLGRPADGIAETLQSLHESGVRIALDDFGTGHASLSHLRQLPVDVLKIDQSFIAELGRPDDHSDEIVAAIIGLAQRLGKHVVAEGVETPAQLDRLVALGCDQVQGYHIGRPVPWRGPLPTARATARSGRT